MVNIINIQVFRNITEKDLYEVACANAITKNDPDVIPMKNVLAGGPGYLLTGSDYYSESESDYDPFPFLKILTNKDRTYGASVILNPGLLCALSHKYNSNFYIIPSSVHELILVIDDADHFDENKANDLYEMVKFVNITEVDPEDVLSDNLYYYNRTEDSLSDIKSYKELAMK